MANNNPSNETYELIKEWLREYHTTKNLRKQNKLKALIVSYMIPVVKNIARTIARRQTDPIDDLIQVGNIGLLKAIDNYDIKVNDNFRVYAGYLIIGEIKHYLRDKSGAIKVPAHIQELIIRINNFTRTLTPEIVEDLTSEDYAVALNVAPKAIDFAMQIERRGDVISLDQQKYSDTETTIIDSVYDDNFKEKSEYEDVRIILDELLVYLSPEERHFVELYYKKDMAQCEIAQMLNLSQSFVSRKMKKAFAKICKLAEEGVSKRKIYKNSYEYYKSSDKTED